MDRRSSHPFALPVAAAAAVIGVIPTVVVLTHADGYVTAMLGALLWQLMVVLAGALLCVNPESRGHGLRLLIASALLGLGLLSDPAFGQQGYWNEIGGVLEWMPVPLLATVLLAYPAAKVATRSGRVLIGMLWVWATVPGTVSALVWNDVAAGYDDTRPWFTVVEMNDVSLAILDVRAWWAAGLAIWFVIVQVGRWRRAHGVARIPIRIMAAGGAALAVTITLRMLTLLAYWAGLMPPVVYAVLGNVQNVIGLLAGAALLTVGLRAVAHRGVVVERLLLASGDPVALQGVLREELVDPTLLLSFRVSGTWVGVDGELSRVPPGAGRMEREIVEDGGVTVARIDADDQVLADPAGLRVTLAAASIAVQNTRLTLERAAHVEEVQASRARIVEAGVARRRELERDLHDGAQQSLLAVAATLSRASLSEDPDEMRAVVGDARGQLSTALDELRRLARGIHPAALSQGGLTGGLASLAAGIPGLALHVDDDLATTNLPAAVESTAYYVIAESVTNAVKHAGSCTVAVDVGLDVAGLRVVVTDDGAGGAAMSPGGGLSGLRDRVRALGGTLDVHSAAAGTQVQAVLPVGATA
ncbi:sensor histidine kinase [Cellulomonas sp. URHD0024]|uniref:sensor histidine kinase n=1 Tax=Cellulomonas sp. URHD0024 TaxID=1302620 RepID=UPI000410A9AE|nr:histidine kinase [Cellulomonas sp. URHD0024]